MTAIPWKKMLPVLAAIALFYTLSLAYFSPVLEGKRLKMGDIRNWQGMAREVDEHRERTGEEALWTGSMFSGMPAYQISVKWSANLLHHVHGVFTGFLPRPASFLFLYLLGMFVLLRILRVDPWLALVGAVAFAFSSYFLIILEAGHTSKASAIGYMPLVLGGAWMLFRGRMLMGATLLALFLALEIAMNHVQVTYYLGMLLLFFVLAEVVRALREKQLPDFLKRAGLGAAAVALALGCNLGLLWSTWEYGQYTTRGKSELTIRPDGSPAEAVRTSGLDRDYITDWSYGRRESLTLLVPHAKGGATGYLQDNPEAMEKANARYRQNVARMNHYWGDQRFTSGPVYLGAIVVLLLVLALANAPGPARWWVLSALPMVLLAVQLVHPLATGVLVLAWALVGLAFWKDTLAYALFAALVLTLLLAWGRNLMPLTDFFLDHVPGYSKFRAVTIILVIVELAAPVLGILYLDRLLREKHITKETQRTFLISAGALATVLVVLAAAPTVYNGLLSVEERQQFNAAIDADPQQEAAYMAFVDNLKRVRGAIFSADAWRSLAFVLAGGLLLFLHMRRTIGRSVVIAGLGVLVLADLWAVDKRYLHNRKDRGRYVKWEEPEASQHPFRASAADKAILESRWNPAAEADHKAQLERLRQQQGRVSPDEDMQLRFASLRRNGAARVLTLRNPFNDASVSWFHRSVGGYHGAKLKRYQELIEFGISPAMQRVVQGLQGTASYAGIDSVLAREGVLNMLNVRHVIYDPERPPLENLNALGNAWFVDEVRWVPNADTEITTVTAIDPARTAVVDERFRDVLGSPPAPDPAASVELDRYATNHLTYTARSESGGVVVFSEIWYGPDWQAYIDGVPVPHARANYVLRALAVPAGEHTVEFRVESRAYDTSRPIMLASSGALLLLVLLMLGMELKRTMGGGAATA
jgi:hypothetical protein